MKHKKAVKLLSRYVSGLLPGDRRIEIENHISGCKECENEINSLNNMITVLKTGPTVKLSSREFEKMKLRAVTGMQRREKPAPPGKGDLRIFSPVFVIGFLLFLFSTIFIGKQLAAELTIRQTLLVAAFIYLQVTGIVSFFLVLYAKKDIFRWTFRLLRDLKVKYNIFTK